MQRYVLNNFRIGPEAEEWWVIYMGVNVYDFDNTIYDGESLVDLVLYYIHVIHGFGGISLN